ncbi:MAG: TIGR01620 family protein [Pseudomonadota bacterium]
MTPRPPLILDLDATPLPDAPAPAEAPEVPEGTDPPARQLLERAARPVGWGLGRTALAALAGLGVLALSVGLYDLVAGLLARAWWLGWPAAALAAVFTAAVLVALAREAAAIVRLRSVARVRVLAGTAATATERGTGLALNEALTALYARRPELAPSLAEIARTAPELTDPQDFLAQAERSLLPPLDNAAEQAVTRAARTVGATTAVLPMAVLDIAVVLYANIAMIRRIAEIYGGRAGWLGSLRLLRAVAGHLLASGAISAGEDLIGPVLGGSVLAKLSRRFGEAAVNAALTARVGIAAMEVCRPLPFATRTPPTARSVVLGALGGTPAPAAR